MEEVKYYHLFTGELAEGRGGLGRISLVLSADFDRVTAERDALQLLLNDLDDLDDQLTTLEQRRHAEQQAREAAERRVDELSAQVAKLEGDNRSMRALMRKRHKQHQSRKHTLRAVVKGVLNAEQVKP